MKKVNLKFLRALLGLFVPILSILVFIGATIWGINLLYKSVISIFYSMPNDQTHLLSYSISSLLNKITLSDLLSLNWSISRFLAANSIMLYLLLLILYILRVLLKQSNRTFKVFGSGLIRITIKFSDIISFLSIFCLWLPLILSAYTGYTVLSNKESFSLISVYIVCLAISVISRCFTDKFHQLCESIILIRYFFNKHESRLVAEHEICHLVVGIELNHLTQSNNFNPIAATIVPNIIYRGAIITFTNKHKTANSKFSDIVVRIAPVIWSSIHGYKGDSSYSDHDQIYQRCMDIVVCGEIPTITNDITSLTIDNILVSARALAQQLIEANSSDIEDLADKLYRQKYLTKADFFYLYNNS